MLWFIDVNYDLEKRESFEDIYGFSPDKNQEKYNSACCKKLFLEYVDMRIRAKKRQARYNFIIECLKHFKEYCRHHIKTTMPVSHT